LIVFINLQGNKIISDKFRLFSGQYLANQRVVYTRAKENNF
jgi:hypothetical protein